MKKKTKKRKILIILLSLLLAIVGILSFAVIFVAAYSTTIDYSFDEALFNVAKSSSVTKLYYDKENMATDMDTYVPELYTEIYSDALKKDWVGYSNISESIKNAFLSMEDRSFFQHKGINIKRSIGALINYFLHFKSSFGGSTITQQVIKNISGDNERSIKRKFNEILRALHIEYSHSKEEIFEVYLNVVNMSENILGVGEASEAYFGKHVSLIDYKEAATLVGIANAPTKYNPYKNPEACREKRNRVLYSLYDCGYIDEAYYKEAINSELGVIAKPEKNDCGYSWFCESVCNEVAKDLSEAMGVSEAAARKLVFGGGYSIYTTVCPRIQTILEDYFEDYSNFPTTVANGLEYSMVISDPYTGNLLGVVGGVGKKEANRILNYAEVRVTPGSTLKPLALYAPLLDEKRINWATVFDDVPIEFTETDGEYTLYPKNSPAIYDGLVTVKDALKTSKNTVAIKLYDMLGGEKIYNKLKENFGFELVYRKNDKNGKIISDISPAPLALGQLSEGITLRQLCEAYNVFPNDGALKKGRSYVSVKDSNGEVLIEKNLEEKRVFSPETARIMNQLLSNVVNGGTANSIKLSEYLDTAGKTGTSGGERDKLFIGYTPYFTAGIWCGYKGTKKPIGSQAISHLEIWDEVCFKIYDSLDFDEEAPGFSISGLQYLPYCKDSGKLFSDICILDPRGDRLEYGYFTDDNAPYDLCNRHRIVKYDVLGEGIALNNCPSENTVEIALVEITDRRFPCEVIITDAEYIYRNCYDSEEESSYELPYFYTSLPPGEYAGISKGKKQFNSICNIHHD